MSLTFVFKNIFIENLTFASSPLLTTKPSPSTWNTSGWKLSELFTSLWVYSRDAAWWHGKNKDFRPNKTFSTLKTDSTASYISVNPHYSQSGLSFFLCSLFLIPSSHFLLSLICVHWEVYSSISHCSKRAIGAMDNTLWHFCTSNYYFISTWRTVFSQNIKSARAIV